jgi:hypothetical protein
MFLFYTLMCRNYQEYKWKPCWSQIGTFQKSVSELFSKMVTLRVEDSVKQKTLQLQSCREFHDKRYRYKIHLILSPGGRVRPNLVRPKMGRRESERQYKGRNPSSWWTPPPTNLQPPEPHFCLPHGSHLHGGGLPWSHEGRGWCDAVLIVFYRPVENPKRKVWWAQQQVFPSVRNQGFIIQEKVNTLEGDAD